MTLSELIPLMMGVFALAFATLAMTRRSRLFRSTVIMLGVLLFTYTGSMAALASPYMGAMGASGHLSDSVGNQSIDEDLSITGDKSQYSGLEYASPTPGHPPLSDGEIRDAIKSKMNDELVADVASGAVILSGTVENKEEARDLIEQIKDIPGVHEITYELGLMERPAS